MLKLRSLISFVDETSVVTTLDSKQPADGVARRSSSSRWLPFLVKFHRHERTLPLLQCHFLPCEKKRTISLFGCFNLEEEVTPSHCRVKSAWTLADVFLRPKVTATVCYKCNTKTAYTTRNLTIVWIRFAVDSVWVCNFVVLNWSIDCTLSVS